MDLFGASSTLAARYQGLNGFPKVLLGGGGDPSPTSLFFCHGPFSHIFVSCPPPQDPEWITIRKKKTNYKGIKLWAHNGLCKANSSVVTIKPKQVGGFVMRVYNETPDNFSIKVLLVDYTRTTHLDSSNRLTKEFAWLAALYIYFWAHLWAHLCILHSGFICIAFCPSVTPSVTPCVWTLPKLLNNNSYLRKYDS